MAFELPTLPYPKDALEPHIDAKTMEIHHDKHHQTYVSKLNEAVGGTPLAEKSLEALCAEDCHLTAVRNNGGGHFNHSLFWQLMSPKGGGAPTGALGDAISATFGDFDSFKSQFTQNRPDSLRLRLGLALQKARQPTDLLHSQPGQPTNA